jgi:hypothetical protein
MATSYFQDPFGAADYSAEGTRGLLDFLRDEYPRVYGAGAGLLGNTPYDTANAYSVFDPKRQAAFNAAQVAFPAGIAAEVIPGVRALKRPAMQLGKAGERLAERVVPQIMERGGMGAGLLGDLSRGSVSPLDVYHGTPHTLPPTPRNPLGEFDASKIGTGEGNQAFGYGIYTAEARPVAEEYAKNLANADKMNQGRLTAHANAQRLAELTGSPEYAADDIRFVLESNPDHEQKKLLKETLNFLESGDYKKPLENKGNLYKVDLPDEKIATMLDWDKPLTEQSLKVRKALAQYMDGSDTFILPSGGSLYNPSGKQIYESITGGADAFSGKGSKAAATKLRELGIAGVKYFDDASRAAGKGTRNFVTFPGEEQNMTILERNGMTSLLD